MLRNHVFLHQSFLRHAAHAITTGGQAPSFGSTFFLQRQELT
jgi:hypothetical protein